MTKNTNSLSTENRGDPTSHSQDSLPDPSSSSEPYLVCAFYKFVELSDYKTLQPKLKELMHQHQVRGTILLAEEGINGTISGRAKDVGQVMDWLRTDARLINIDAKTSLHHEPPPQALNCHFQHYTERP